MACQGLWWEEDANASAKGTEEGIGTRETDREVEMARSASNYYDVQPPLTLA